MSSTTTPPRPEITPKDWVFLFLEIFLAITVPFVVQRIFEDIPYIPIILTGAVLIILSWIFIKPRWQKLLSIAVVFVVVTSLSFYSYFTSRPSVSLNFLNLPYSERDTYYVTDSMVRAKGDLSLYPSFTLSPLELEIVPRYSGKERFGNVVLRISGNSQTKDYPLWTDFDSSAETKTVSISLADIVILSGIQVNYSEVDTSLTLEAKPYQEESLSFQVIQLSEPRKPFQEEKKLAVINTPWIQTTRIVGRNNTRMVDYSLKNLGPEATFHCRISIAKVEGVGEDDHDFWSGIDEDNVHYGPDCSPFVLKKNEVYQISAPLDAQMDFERGRYLVQIYTFAERSDLQFANSASYETSYDMWVIGKDAQVLTFVVCNDPGKTCQQSMTYPIEQGNIDAFAYDSRDYNQNGYSYLVVTSRTVENRIANHYRLDYWLDPQQDGWVGLALAFRDPVDVSAFNAIQFNLELGDKAFPVWIQFSSTDGNDEINKRVLIGDGNYGDKRTDIQTVIIPLSAFPDIDWQSVSAINFVIDSYMVPDTDHHELHISNFEFIWQ